MTAGLEAEQAVVSPSGGFQVEDWYRASHDRMVRTLAVAVSDVDIAADSVAEAFARAVARVDQVGAMENRDGWVYRTALNVARRRLRRAAIEARLLLRYRVTDANVPEDVDDRVWAAVHSLTDRQRQAIALRYVADLSEKDVAAVLGVAEGTASATLSTARRRLAELLREKP